MRPSQVLKRLNELRKVYQEQTFKFTPEQQKEYDRLIELRRERVKSFHADGKVSKGGTLKQNVEVT